jgi:hypothetical protein
MPATYRYASVALVAALLAGIYIAYAWGPRPSSSHVVRVQSVVSDAVDAPAGHTDYLLTVNATNEASSPWQFSPSLLRVTSNASQTYSPDSAYNVTTLLGGSDLAPGASARGVVVFQLPIHESPAKVEYGGASPASVVPSASAYALRFSVSVQITVNGVQIASGGWTGSSCPTSSGKRDGPVGLLPDLECARPERHDSNPARMFL